MLRFLLVFSLLVNIIIVPKVIVAIPAKPVQNIIKWNSRTPKHINLTASDPAPGKIYAVNLGGWLVLEPWIRPSIFEQFTSPGGPVDEWTFTQYLGPTEAKAQLEQHWSTWVTESDISLLASYGINLVRIPIGYWAFDIQPGEPYVSGAWDHMATAIGWAAKYGISVMADLHGAPGSQNGFDNSGKRGPIQWQTGDPNNVPRTIKVLQIMIDKINALSLPNTVTGINILNEPLMSPGGNQLGVTQKFYLDAYNAVRAENGGILVVFHDAFQPLTSWQGFFNPPTYQNVALDTHIYLVFDYGLLALNNDQKLDYVCKRKADIAASNNNVRTIVGEWSLAITDCAKWLNGLGVGSRWDGTYNGSPPVVPGATCVGDGDYKSYTQEQKQYLRDLAETQMDAFEAGAGWIFWNFKTESAPQWDYILGVQQGWIPGNPSQRTPRCN